MRWLRRAWSYTKVWLHQITSPYCYAAKMERAGDQWYCAYCRYNAPKELIE